MSGTSTHIGRKISRIRELRGMKQESLAAELGVSQQAISKLEQSEKIEDDVLEKVARALGVTPETVKNYSDEAAIYNIQNNYEGSKLETGQQNYSHCSFNVLDKLMETLEEVKLLHEENRKLYERLLQSEQEKNTLLRSAIDQK
jgi:transcriptional regulator with XRE-family HTH domain